MPSWRTPEELQRDGVVFTKFMHVLLGLYLYEWFLSLDFEWDFISGKKKFRWPLIFYFANRYLLLFAMIGIAIALNRTTPLDCQALYTFNGLAGDAALGLASINLSIRTMAIWSQNRYLVGFLVLIILGHWSLILQGIELKAVWVPGIGCAITETRNTILAAIFIYSMCFDLIVFLLNTYKLVGISQSKQRLSQSRLAQLIFSDGLIYFFIAFLANLVATVFMLLNLNQIMSVIFNVPAAVFSTIVACRAVRRLTNFSYDGPQVFSSASAPQFKNPTLAAQSVHLKSSSRPGVRVQMETFTQPDHRNTDIFPKSKSGSETDVDSPDIEAKGGY